ncbi:MAG: alpha/beta hydrolase, partial [Chloroflexota bacterium]|nr:alpha/beta hydrolase [Chloroflexota bacterium]
GWKYDLAIREARRQGTVPPNKDLWPEIPQITCPTLIVRGADTDILTTKTAQRMVEVMPKAQIAEIPRSGHMVFEDNPSDFNTAIGSFLK